MADRSIELARVASGIEMAVLYGIVIFGLLALFFLWRKFR
jgi:hypothetical protein